MKPVFTCKNQVTASANRLWETRIDPFFGQENAIFGGGLTTEITRFVDVGAEVNRMTVKVGPGGRDPSIETIFDSSQAPLFSQETDFNIYGVFVKFNLLEQYNFPPAGLDVSVGAWRYEDTDLGRGSFTRIVGDVRAQIPLGFHSRRIALRARTSNSFADGGEVVPIYMMETIGGATTLRGYDEYRFRDARNLTLTAEYRWEAWTYLDFALFYDAGKVFSDEDDFDFKDLHTAYGFGMRVHAPGEVFFNIDLARSTEGLRLHIGGGPSF